MKEIWKDIKDYEGLYQISNMGNFKNRHNKPVFPYKSNIQLSRNGKAKTFSVMRLVAETFVENPRFMRYVKTKNGLKGDFRAENLIWYEKPILTLAKRTFEKRKISFLRKS